MKIRFGFRFLILGAALMTQGCEKKQDAESFALESQIFVTTVKDSEWFRRLTVLFSGNWEMNFIKVPAGPFSERKEIHLNPTVPFEFVSNKANGQEHYNFLLPKTGKTTRKLPQLAFVLAGSKLVAYDYDKKVYLRKLKIDKSSIDKNDQYFANRSSGAAAKLPLDTFSLDLDGDGRRKLMIYSKDQSAKKHTRYLPVDSMIIYYIEKDENDKSSVYYLRFKRK